MSCCSVREAADRVALQSIKDLEIQAVMLAANKLKATNAVLKRMVVLRHHPAAAGEGITTKST